MHEQNWSSVDHYFADRLVTNDPLLDSVVEANAAAGLPPHAVSPPLGKFLHLLAKSHAARNILEIGTLGGYSSAWLAQALPPDGNLITLEIEPRHASVAEANFARLGLSCRIEIRLGDALDTLAALDDEQIEPFDFVFIDADKHRSADYFAWALRLARDGALIVIDNVVRNGAVVNQDSDDPNVIGVRAVVDLIEREASVSATALQTVGSKGYDGFILAVIDRQHQTATT